MQQKATLTTRVNGLEQDVPTLISLFQEQLQHAPFRGRLAAASPTHPYVRGVAYSFTDEEPSQALRDDSVSFVVHHDSRISTPGIVMCELLTEHLVPFAPATRGQVDLSTAELAAVLSGGMTTWDALGYGAGTIRLLGHGGRVHHRVFTACIARNFALQGSAPIELFPSYSDLAAAARDCDRCLVFGLRPAYTRGAGLRPVTIEGTKPWDGREPVKFPSVPIYIGWRRDSEGAEAVGRDLAYYLKVVLARLEADARILETWVGSNLARAA